MNALQDDIVLATERIDFQRDDFGQKLEVLITQLCNDIRTDDLWHDNLDKHPVVGKLTDLIFKRLCIKVKFITGSHLAAILPFYSNKNHIFLTEFLRGWLDIKDQSKVLKKFENTGGTVNLATAKVSGIFSEYVHPLYINFTKMMSELDLTPGEITGAMLHELGHAFEACYYSDRTDRTNQVLANVHRTITGTRTTKDIEYVHREIQKLTDKVQAEEIDKILNGTPVIAGAAWFKMMIKVVNSQMLQDKYNESAFEEAADSFAGRFGYGKNVTMVLEKLYKDTRYKSTALLTMSYLFDFLVVGCLVAAVGVSIVGGFAVVAVYSSFLMTAMMMLSGEDMKDYTYDALKMRYKRLRYGMIEELKEKNLDPSLVKNILESIYAMDTAIESTKDYQGPMDKFCNLLFSKSRASFQNVEAQQIMEALSANDLFVKAAEIKNHA